MLALRTLAILCSALFLLALVPTETAAVQIDSDLATTVEVDADGQYVFSIVSDGGSRLLIDGAVVIDDAATHPLGPVPSDPTFLTLGTHALRFNADTVPDGQIVVRRARDGEELLTIDHERRTLDPRMLVIADSSRAIGLAGIMGGAETEATSLTRSHFDWRRRRS